MANAKLPQLYGQALTEPQTVMAQLYAQALLTDEQLNPALLSDLYAQFTFEQNAHVADLYVQALVDPHPYPWMTADVVSFCYCWKITLRNGTTYGFTNHDQDLTFDGVTYEAATGFIPTAVDTSSSLSVDNLDVDGMLTSDRITEDDITAGLYDFAAMTIYLVNWQNLNDPKLILRRGTIGQISHDKNAFTAEVRGLLESYQQKAGKVYQKVCRATLGDSKCKVNLTPYTATGTITAVCDDMTFGTNLAAAADLYDYGVITFTSGKNNNAYIEVKTQAADGTVELYLPPPWPPAVGDTFTIVAGCDGNFSTCQTKFNNRFNFRGEPYVPGTDYLVSYPLKGSGNVVQTNESAARGGSTG